MTKWDFQEAYKKKTVLFGALQLRDSSQHKKFIPSLHVSMEVGFLSSYILINIYSWLFYIFLKKSTVLETNFWIVKIFLLLKSFMFQKSLLQGESEVAGHSLWDGGQVPDIA